MGMIFGKKKDKTPKPEGGKWYKIINTSAIIGLFVAVGLLVLMITGIIGWSSAMVGLTLGIAIVCFCCILALPWIRRLEKGEFKIMSYVFLGLVALCCVLWVIADIIIIKQYRNIRLASKGEFTDEQISAFIRSLLHSLNYFKFTTFITIQFSVASFVAAVIIKLRKNMLVLQGIAYASYAVCDFWISGILLSISIKSNAKFGDSLVLDEIFSVNAGFLKFLVSKVMLTILFLAIAYVIVSNVIIKKQEQRMIKNVNEDTIYGAVESQPNSEKQEETIEVKLEKLKKMYEGELISKEEYESKKSEILKDL